MSHLINKLLGREDESESHSHKAEVNTSASSSSGSGQQAQRKNSGGGQVSEGRTVQHEGVNIKSTISSDTSSTVSMANQQKLNDLVAKLGSTHTQIDEYSKKQAKQINDEIQREIDQVVARTRQNQDELLRKANEHTAQIDAQYRAQLQQMVEQVDAVKAKRIAEVEQELNTQQAGILEAARNEIDLLNQRAANLKIGALQQAQAKASADVSDITAQATNLGQASTIHQAQGTTTIKTEVSGVATTTDVGASSSSSGSGHGGTSGGSSHGGAGGGSSYSSGSGHGGAGGGSSSSGSSHGVASSASSGSKTVETSHQSHGSKK